MMDWIVTLAGSPSLPEPLAMGLARGLGVEDGPDWLSPGRACELRVRRDEAPILPAEPLDAARIDRIVQPDRPDRRKRLLLADMDSTIVTSESLDDLAAAAGVGARVAEITRRAMRGEIDFTGAVRERVGLLSGLPSAMVETVVADMTLSGGAATLVGTMRANGALCVLVSGGFLPFADAVGAACGFDHVHANGFDVDDGDGTLTGRVLEPILDRDAKIRLLQDYCRQLGVPAEAAAAVGDGANDLAMVTAAGLGVSFRGKPTLRQAAGSRIDHGDLRTMLYFQGYRDTDIEKAG